MRVLVTGANGMIGRAVCNEISAAGFTVRAAVRRPQTRAAAAEVTATGDIGPLTDWSEALQGVDAVVHIAGYAHANRFDERACIEVNVGGTGSLAAAAGRAGVEHVIYLSTAKVHGEVSGAVAFAEEDPPRPADSYARSKLAAENVLQERSGEFASTVIRVPLVYGPGVKANFLRLLRLVERGVPLPVGGVNNLRSMVFVGNVADAIRHVLTCGAASGETYLVSDGTDVSTADLVTRLAHALGRHPRVLTLPRPLRTPLLLLARRSGTARRLVCSFQVDSRRIRSELGWTPPVTLEEGIARTVEWYCAAGT
jgi:nucleoside-diphosphate-sugar epimerase